MTVSSALPEASVLPSGANARQVTPLECPLSAGNSFSRYQEYQADIYSLEVTHGIVPDPGQSCAWSFQKFGEQVFVDPDPNPLAVALFYDHPTVSDRIRLCATYDPWSNGQSPRFVK